jgi:hypothetical protein
MSLIDNGDVEIVISFIGSLSPGFPHMSSQVLHPFALESVTNSWVVHFSAGQEWLQPRIPRATQTFGVIVHRLDPIVLPVSKCRSGYPIKAFDGSSGLQVNVPTGS